MAYRSIVVLTGAGISAESGIKTFRDAGGLWEGYPVEQVASPQGFAENPDLVYEFYNQRRRQLQNPDVQPNAAHLALAEFAKKFQGKFLLVTQNVDNLHERAGSENVIHMHGQLMEIRCLYCDKVHPWTDDLNAQTRLNTCCAKNSPLRPHIVWFGEMPLFMDQIIQHLQTADLFVSIGTSGHVYPAAGFVKVVQRNCKKVEINLDQTLIGNNFDTNISGPASKAVPDFFRSL